MVILNPTQKHMCRTNFNHTKETCSRQIWSYIRIINQ